MKYFITFYGGGHVAMCIPVIRELLARGHEVTALALTAAGAVMQREGLAHKRPVDYVNFAEVESYGRKLLAAHHTEGKGISVEESIAYLGVSMRDLVAWHGEEKAWQLYREQGLAAFCPVDFLTQVLKQEKPDAVIATTSPRMERAAFRAAHALGIPSLCITDLFLIYDMERVKCSDQGTLLTVFYKKTRQRVIAAGRKPGEVIVTGNPAFDPLAQYDRQKTSQAYRAKKHIEPGTTLILWAEQPEPANPDLPRRVRRRLQEICRAQGWQLLVRLHPSSTDASKERIPEGALQSHAHEPLHEAICAADALVTLTSTAAMEALLMDVPAMLIAISQYQHFVDYSEEDGALVVGSLEEAEQGLKQLIEGGALAERLRENRRRLPRPGKATPAICDLLEQLTSAPPNRQAAT